MSPAIRKILKSPTLAGLIGLVVFCAILEAAIDLGWVMELVVARPSDAILAILPLQEEMNLFGAFLTTLAMTSVATALALSVGIPFGYLMYRSHLVGTAYEGWLAAAFAAPTVLLYPLFLVMFGRSHLTLVLMGFIPGAIPIAIQTRQGLLGVSRTLVNVGRSFNVNEREMFWKIQLPAAVPTIFTIVAIEYLIDFGGLGRIVSEMYFRFEIPGTYASIIAVVLVSVFFYWGFGRIERWLRPV